MRALFLCFVFGLWAENDCSPGKLTHMKSSGAPYLGKDCTLPASTLTMLPVDLAEASEAKK